MANRHDLDEAFRLGHHVWINRGERVGLQRGHRKALSLPKGSPSSLACKLPGGATRDPVAQQAHLEPGHPLVAGHGFPVAALPVSDVAQKEFQRLGPDRARCDQLMAGMDS